MRKFEEVVISNPLKDIISPSRNWHSWKAPFSNLKKRIIVANKPQPILCTVWLFYGDWSVPKIWQNSRCYNIGSLWYIWNKMTMATLGTMMPKVIETLSRKTGSRICLHSILFTIQPHFRLFTLFLPPQGVNYHSLSLFYFYTFFASPQGGNYDWIVKVTDLPHSLQWVAENIKLCERWLHLERE